MMTYEAPRCPQCEEVLDSVNENDYSTYEFDSVRGCYTPDGYIKINCPYCDFDLRETPEFASGACNYHVYRQEQEARRRNE